MSMKEIWTLPLLGALLCICQRRERETIFIAETRNEKNKQQTKGNKPKNYNWKRKYLHSFLRPPRSRLGVARNISTFKKRWESTSAGIYGFSLLRGKRFLGCRNKLTRKRGEQRWSSGITGKWILGQWFAARSFRWTQTPQNSFEMRIWVGCLRKIKIYLIWVRVSAGLPWRARRSASCRRLFWAFGLMEAVSGTEICQDGWQEKRKKKHKIKIKINSGFKNQFGGTKEIERKKIGDEWKIASLKLS